MDHNAQKAILEFDCGRSEDFERFVKKDKQKDLLSKTDNLLKGKADIKTDPYSDKLREGVLEVQYNPATIRYNASASEQEEQDIQNAQINTIVSTSTVNMSFDLVFHSRYAKDKSVREQMDLVMNVLCSSPTREVKFSWAKMYFTGKLVSFSGEYDMFDSDGMPVSGHMSLTIQSQEKTVKERKVLEKADEQREEKVKRQ